jgi:hypothetical protein
MAPVAEDGPQEPTTAQVRSWARGQGIDVPARGKLRAAIWDVYQARPPHDAPVRFHNPRTGLPRCHVSGLATLTSVEHSEPWTEQELDALVEEATVDAYDTEEQLSGLFTMVQEHLAVPFTTTVLGVQVTVEDIDLTEGSHIVACCVRGPWQQAIGILDLPLPAPAPEGAQWIAAYRRWAP